MKKTKRLVLLAMLTAVAMILSYVESLLPSVGIPGVKMGLANIAVIFALFRFGWKEAAALSLVRVVLVSLLFGSVGAMLYSLAGAVLSLAVMASFGSGDTELSGSELIIVRQGTVDGIEDLALFHASVLQLINTGQKVTRMLVRSLAASPRITAGMTLGAVMLQNIIFAAVLKAKIALQIFLNRIHHISTLPFSALQ